MTKDSQTRVLLVGLQRFRAPVGLCRYTANIFNCLRQLKGLQVTLVLGLWQKGYYGSALQVNVEDPNILWIDLRNPSLSRYGWCMWSLPKLARKLHVHVVHLLHQLPVVKPLFHCPVVLTMHDLYAYDTPEAIGYPNVYLNRLVIWSSIKASREIVSISFVTKERLQYWYPSLGGHMKLPVIYQSVSVSIPKAPAEAIAGPFLLCVAQHRKHKNLDLVIESYFLALERGAIHTTTQLVIVGSEGPETEYLNRISERETGVHFLHSISDEYLAYLYSTCKVYICASSTEGFCLPLVEAMLFSCRVVCADIPILNEVAGGRATYFTLDVHSTESIINAIESALGSDHHITATSLPSSASTAEEWLALYQGLAEAAIVQTA